MKAIARLCYQHRRLTVAAWIGIVAVLIPGSGAVGTGFVSEFVAPPGTESERATELLEENGFATRTGEVAQVVFQAPRGIDDPAVQQAIEGLLADVAVGMPEADIASPYEPGGKQNVSNDRTIAFAEISFPMRTVEEDNAAGERISELAGAIAVEGLRIELGGNMFIAGEEGPSSEMFGLVGAVIVLLVAFGSLLAMALPILVALFGIGSGTGLIEGTTRFIDMPDFTIAAAAMIGIGVGIDYALLVVTRYREALRAGRSPLDATVLSIDTAGRSVVFAGTTVVISLLGLMFMGIDMIRGVAIACSLAVLMTMLASLTLLPAMLGFAGHRIDALGLPWRTSGSESGRGSIWHRWSRVIQHHPWPAAIAGFVLLLALCAPVLDLRLGFADAGSHAEGSTTREAYDLLVEGFGPGFTGPLIVVAEAPDEAARDALTGLSATLDATDGVASASPPIFNAEGTAAIIQVVPTASPQDEATSELVGRLRRDVIPAALDGTSGDVAIGGLTAGSEDFAAYIAERLPIFFGAVLLLSFILLMAVFRSLLVPLKAVIMNLLSIGAAYGILVAIFQWGIGADLLGIGKEGPIEAWVPMMLFAIVFGLSMDYEVFLLSRVREEYDRTGDNGLAVADGLAATARVITAAAAIMCIVFGSFALGDERALKLLGTGLAVAIFIDATVVRMLLVPATMEILGDRNWWLPGWLDRVLPRIHVEPERDAAPVAGGYAAPALRDREQRG